MKTNMTEYTCDYCDAAERHENYVHEPGLPRQWLKVGSQYICGAHEVAITYHAGDFYAVQVSDLLKPEPCIHCQSNDGSHKVDCV